LRVAHGLGHEIADGNPNVNYHGHKLQDVDVVKQLVVFFRVRRLLAFRQDETTGFDVTF
jgi:hypothetical protein